MNVEENGGGDVSRAITLRPTPWPRNKEYVEVYVSAVANPGIFWVQIVSSMALQLDEMTSRMSRHYSEVKEEVYYAKTPMQYTAIFHGCENVNFQMKS